MTDCPLCATELVHGWWCPQCRKTKDECQLIADVHVIMEPTWYDIAVPIAALSVFLVVVVVLTIWGK